MKRNSIDFKVTNSKGNAPILVPLISVINAESIMVCGVHIDSTSSQTHELFFISRKQYIDYIKLSDPTSSTHEITVQCP